MLRDEQIVNVTATYQAKLLEQGYDVIAACNRSSGFYEGAKWADANPQWHKCEDGLPEPNIKVLCYTKKGTYFVAWTEDTHWGLKWSRWKCPIIAWMELPQPPKFD